MREAGSEALIQALSQLEDTRKQASAIAWVEVRSAIRRRQRLGELLAVNADIAVDALGEEFQRIIIHPLTGALLEQAAVLLDRHDLRTLDSIQLASAQIARASLTNADVLHFVASDTKLLSAAQAEGFHLWDPADPSSNALM